jgi:alanine dehydrogenase
LTRILNNQEITEILSMDACITALREAYLDFASGVAVTRRRSDTLIPSGESIYGLKTMDGIAPSLGVGAVRINSDIVTWPKVGTSYRRVKVPAAPGSRYTGLILVFSTETGELLAIMPDGVIQRMRVGATSALGTDYLAKKEARTAAIIGSGWQAGAQLMGLLAVRPEIHTIRVFSPNLANVETFCREWGGQFSQEFFAFRSIVDAVQGADVVLCATSSIDPVFESDYFEPGMHVGSIKPPEISKDALDLADKVCVHLGHGKPALVQADNLIVPDHSGDRGWKISDAFDFSSCTTLPELVSGSIGGRANHNERTCFVNDLGLGLQFAVVAGVTLRLAESVGVGQVLPTELLTQVEHP